MSNAHLLPLLLLNFFAFFFVARLSLFHIFAYFCRFLCALPVIINVCIRTVFTCFVWCLLILSFFRFVLFHVYQENHWDKNQSQKSAAKRERETETTSTEKNQINIVSRSTLAAYSVCVRRVYGNKKKKTTDMILCVRREWTSERNKNITDT